MALAACGGPTFRGRFRDLIRLDADGRFDHQHGLSSATTATACSAPSSRASTTASVRRARGRAADRPPSRPGVRAPGDSRGSGPALVARLSRTYRSRNLCLSGGVALNCVANARILRDTDYERVWIPPCASDSGALIRQRPMALSSDARQPRRFELTHPFYGTATATPRSPARWSSAGLQHSRMSEKELLAQVAQRPGRQQDRGLVPGPLRDGTAGPRQPLHPVGRARRSDEGPDQCAGQVSRAFRPFAPAVLTETRVGVLRDRSARSVHDDGAQVRADKVISSRRPSTSTARAASRPSIARRTRATTA